MTLDQSPNPEQAEYWNGDEARHWLEHEARYERMLAPLVPVLLDAAELDASDRVLDVGCGAGATTRAAAARVVRGEAVGVDLSRPMLDCAERRAREAGLTNVRFEQGDAQIHPFSPEFSVVLSRFGVMFFADPPAAFTNLARALTPGGRLAFTCWRPAFENEWITVPGLAVAAHISLPERAQGGPGPFAFGDADVVRDILTSAGFVDIRLDRVDQPRALGDTVPDTIAFFRESGIGKAMLADASPATIDAVVASLTEALAPYASPDGVRLGSAAWLVTARTGLRS
jgi:SAM-dependent methyltransferase